MFMYKYKLNRQLGLCVKDDLKILFSLSLIYIMQTADFLIITNLMIIQTVKF